MIQDNGQLVEMKESFYESELLLQSFLENYPKLLSGEQISPNNPRRWLLIKSEAGIPSKEGEGGRWAVDHLFLDQDAIPTIVEVKRSTDTRIRREVVGKCWIMRQTPLFIGLSNHLRQSLKKDVKARI